MQASRNGIAPNEYYHIYNRGAGKHALFREKTDWERFLFSVIFLQSPFSFPQAGRMARSFSNTQGFMVPLQNIEDIVQERFVELSAFCFMSNHFHLLIKEVEEGGIAKYMQRIEVAYTLYFNKKYNSSGHVFQGPYNAVHIEDNRQLLHTSAYIHLNPRELRDWKGKETEYPWSSLQDYVTANRWGGLLETDIIAKQLTDDNSNYETFIQTSPAKAGDDYLFAFENS